MIKTYLGKVWNGLVAFFSSYALAAAIFLFLLLLTYLGTLEQVEHGLYLTQKKYFESIFLVHNFFGVIPVPLPGVYLLLVLLFFNIIAGGIFRMRKGWRQTGILITHAGIVLLLVGGFITYNFAIDGHMTLYENDRSNVFKSYHDWEIALERVTGDGDSEEFVLPGGEFQYLDSGDSTTFQSEQLPFTVTLSDFAPNAMPRPKGPMFDVEAEVVDGFYLERLPREQKNERNIAGIYATVQHKETGETFQTILWGMQKTPASFNMGGEKWRIDLRHQQWKVPFTIVLEDFRRELHPRTTMPKAFESDVIKIEDGREQHINISMNEPLRHQGYTFFQASWGPQDAGPNDPLFSSFAVVKNPADKFPLYACIVITFGMVLHFVMKLHKYLKAESKRPS